MDYVSKEIDGGDQWTDWVSPPSSGEMEYLGYVVLAIKGTWEGTLTLQVDFGDDDGVFDLDTFNSNTVKNVYLPTHTARVRVGCASSDDYSSGTADVRIYIPSA